MTIPTATKIPSDNVDGDFEDAGEEVFSVIPLPLSLAILRFPPVWIV
jgi:hypothetical protein